MFNFLNKLHTFSWENGCVFCLKLCQNADDPNGVHEYESDKTKQLNHLVFNSDKSSGFQSFFWQLVAGVRPQTTNADYKEKHANANPKKERSNDSNCSGTPKLFTCSECSKSILQLQHLHSELERIQMLVIRQVRSIQSVVDQCQKENTSERMSNTHLDQFHSIQQQIMEHSKRSVLVPLVLVEKLSGKLSRQLPDMHSTPEILMMSNFKVEPTEVMCTPTPEYASDGAPDFTVDTQANWSPIPDATDDSEEEYVPPTVHLSRSRSKPGSSITKVGSRPKPKSKRKSIPVRLQVPTQPTLQPPSDKPPDLEKPWVNHFQCAHCPKSYQRFPPYQKHLETAHKVKPNPQSSAQHSETRDDSGKKKRRYNCPSCGELFYSATLQYKHRMAVHGAPVSKCKECDKEFTTPSNLAVHKMITHSSKAPRFHCDVCDMTFRQKCTYVNHMEAKHGGDEKRFTCEICGFMTKTKRFLARHRLTHNKQHECTVCGRKCATRCSLKTHMRVHTGEVVICHECGYEFHNAKSLRRHVRNYHTGDNPLPLYPPQKRRKPRSHWKDFDDGKRYYATNVVGTQEPGNDKAHGSTGAHSETNPVQLYKQEPSTSITDN